MGLSWFIDHMEKGIFLNSKGEIENVKNVFLKNDIIDTRKVEINNLVYATENFLEYFDYKVSFDDIQFLGKENADEIMKNVLFDLGNLKEIDTSYYSKKILKSGEQKTYFCQRKTKLNNTFFFYHNNTEQHPHIHIFIPNSIPLGKKCIKLRNEINKIFKKYNLIPSTEIKNNYGDAIEEKIELKKFQTIKKTLEKISWLYKQAESKVVNQNMSIQKYLDSKSEIVKDERGKLVKMYKSNHCFFSLEEKSIWIDREMTKGKNKGKIEKIKVHSIFEVMKNYSQFSNIGGSKEFLNSIIDKIEYIENVKVDKKLYLQKYEKINFNNPLETIRNLALTIDRGEKISSDYKKFWRENITSENMVNKKLAENIQKLYKERKNNVYEYSKEKLIEKYNDAILEIKESRSTIDYKKILEKLEIYLNEEINNDKNICEKLKKDFPEKEKIYIKNIEGKQFLIIDKEKIDLSIILKKNNIRNTYEKIKENREKYIEKIEIDNEYDYRTNEILEDIGKNILKDIYIDNFKPEEKLELKFNSIEKFLNKFEMMIEYAKNYIDEIIEKIKEICSKKESKIEFDEKECSYYKEKSEKRER